MLVAVLALAGTARAQEIRGTVVDSVTRQPVAGAVATLQDARGEMLSRTITNERGQFRLAAIGEPRSILVKRIGFRPRTVSFTGNGPIDIALAAIPSLLEPVTVEAAGRCPRRNDRTAALSLLQQARAGILNSVVAREQNPPAMMRLTFVRDRENDGEILHQEVGVDSGAQAKRSFQAVRSAAEFVKFGFTMDGTPSAVFLGPDAEVLLDDSFAAGYCFRIDDPRRERQGQVGLGFWPSSREKGRVDIEGTLWVDTLAHALEDIEYKYVGVEHRVGQITPGGHIEFREMGNGVVLIDRWNIQMVGVKADNYHDVLTNNNAVRAHYLIHEAGGEVAGAWWKDGFAWEASLGALRVQALDYRTQVARGAVVRLKDTDYLASPNADGILVIGRLLPGLYTGTVIDSVSARFNIAMPTSLHFTAERDSVVQRSFTIPRHEEYVREACLTSVPDQRPRVLVKVTTKNGRPAENVSVFVSRKTAVEWQTVDEVGRTNDRGLFESCLRFDGHDTFDVTVHRNGERPFTGTFRVNQAATQVTLVLPNTP